MEDNLDEELIIDEVALSDDEALDFTTRVRTTVVKRMLSDADVVDDPKAMNTLIKILDGMDRTALGKKRAESASVAAKGLGNIAHALDNIVIAQGSKYNRPPDIEGELDGYRPPVPELPIIDLPDGILDPVGTPVDVLSLLEADLERKKDL